MVLRFKVTIAVALLFCIGCCGRTGSNVSNSNHQPQQSPTSSQYIPPTIPSIIATDKEKLEYIANNYWRNFDFRDTSMIRSKVAERAFTNYIYALLGVSKDVANRGLTKLFEASSVDSLMLDNFIEISEKYLYDPNSPMRNEELYIPILRYIVSTPHIDKWGKIRPQHQLDMALKNRVGEVATDFVITMSDGKKTKLSKIKGDLKLLLFNNPDCPDCKRIKELIISNEGVFSKATVVSVYIDSDLELWRATSYPEEWINGYDKDTIISNSKLYDLKAIPTIYLLDSENKIMLKDASIERVAQLLSTYNAV